MKTITRILIPTVTLLLALPLVAEDAKHATKPESGKAEQPAYTDAHFLMKADKSGRDEVQLSKLALEKSQNAEVRAFAQELVSDHSRRTRNWPRWLKLRASH